MDLECILSDYSASYTHVYTLSEALGYNSTCRVLPQGALCLSEWHCLRFKKNIAGIFPSPSLFCQDFFFFSWTFFFSSLFFHCISHLDHALLLLHTIPLSLQCEHMLQYKEVGRLQRRRKQELDGRKVLV